jgi:hypothetical protein
MCEVCDISYDLGKVGGITIDMKLLFYDCLEDLMGRQRLAG